MLRNYLKVALRSLRRQTLYASINVVGLGVGAACCLLIVLYVRHELSFDTYHEKGERIYRMLDYGGLGDTKRWSSYVTGDPIEPMRTSFPDVEAATKLMTCGADRITLGTEVYREITMWCGEPELFDIFSFDIVRGTTEALARPNTAVITRSVARRLFGSDDPVGKALPIQFGDSLRAFQIAGLMEDVPPNTHFTFDVLLSYASLRSASRCLDCGQPMYALLTPTGDPKHVADRVLRHIREIDGEEHVEDVRLESIEAVHFSEVHAPRQGDIRYVYILSGIAVVILLLGCANYMNLATARFSTRVHEVGVRKALGARRGELIRQFLFETLLLTAGALPIAVGLVAAGLPLLNQLAEAQVTLTWQAGGVLVLGVAALIVVITLLAGSYPAYFLSEFEPAEVLRGRFGARVTAVGLRKGLVVFQFAVAIALIGFTGVIAKQLRFVQQKNLGFEADQIVTVRVADPELQERPETLKEEFLRRSSVREATAGHGVPGDRGFHRAHFIYEPEGEDGPSITFATPFIDADFLEMMDIPLLAGRNIDDGPADFAAVEGLINEAGLRAMGWSDPAEALGKEIARFTVVGVVPDFHYASMHNDIKPLLMQQNYLGRATMVALRVDGRDLQQAVEDVRATWQELGTEQPLEFSFLSDEIDALYQRERRAAKLFALFAGLAVLIACLGLFGLASFAAERRTQEVGIRKALGASAPQIAWLFVRDFSALVLLALLLAAPIIYVAGERWLADFSYHAGVGPGVMVVAGAGALAVAILAMGYQALRATMVDPAESLRYE